MELKEYDSNELIEFYSKNGLEISKEHSYLGSELKSFVIMEEKIIGAITLSKYKNKDFLEAIAIIPEYQKQGISKILLNKAKELTNKELYTISKLDGFYLKNDFEYIEDNYEMISNNCKMCEEYKKNCHPKVMIYKK